MCSICFNSIPNSLFSNPNRLHRAIPSPSNTTTEFDSVLSLLVEIADSIANTSFNLFYNDYGTLRKLDPQLPQELSKQWPWKKIVTDRTTKSQAWKNTDCWSLIWPNFWKHNIVIKSSSCIARGPNKKTGCGFKAWSGPRVSLESNMYYGLPCRFTKEIFFRHLTLFIVE